MKYFREVMIFMIAVLLFAMVIGAMMNAGGADAQVVGFGNLEAELRRLAQQDTDRFMDAVKVSWQALDPSNKTLFKETLISELGLDVFPVGQKHVEKLTLIRAGFAEIYENPDAVLAAGMAVGEEKAAVDD